MFLKVKRSDVLPPKEEPEYKQEEVTSKQLGPAPEEPEDPVIDEGTPEEVVTIVLPISSPSVPVPEIIQSEKLKHFNSHKKIAEAIHKKIAEENKDESLLKFFETHCIALLDTGIDKGHHDLRGSDITLMGTDIGSVDAIDEHGHGTHIAGLITARGKILGVFPGAPILSYKITRRQSSEATWASISVALENIIDQKEKSTGRISVVNLSFNGPDNLKDDEERFMNHTIWQQIKRLHDLNIPVVVSGGNNYPLFAEAPEDKDTYGLGYPANFENVIACGASCSSHDYKSKGQPYQMDEKELAPFTQRQFDFGSQKKLFIAVPAIETESTGLKGGYSTLTGSSMAAPYITGLILLKQYLYWKQHPNNSLSVNEIKKDLSVLCDKEKNQPKSGFSITVGQRHMKWKNCFDSKEYDHLNINKL